MNCVKLHLVGNRSIQFRHYTQTSTNSSTIAAGSSNGLTSARNCKYSCVCSWRWVEIPPETCRAVFQKQIKCVTLHLVGNISKGIYLRCTDLWTLNLKNTYFINYVLFMFHLKLKAKWWYKHYHQIELTVVGHDICWVLSVTLIGFKQQTTHWPLNTLKYHYTVVWSNMPTLTVHTCITNCNNSLLYQSNLYCVRTIHSIA